MFKKSQMISLTESKFNYAFIKANRFLLKKYHEKIKEENKKDEILKSLWLNEYNAELVNINDTESTSWTHICFKNESDKLMFLIKWGQS